MKHFKWEDLLRRHPIFSRLTEQELARLLEDEVSEERVCPPQSVILREGEVGDSIFLIGSGSVQVVLLGKDGQEIMLAIFRNGEVFGEMGLFQEKPRSATVIAKEPCTLLEIKGEEFLKLAHTYPDIELKMLLTVSERLRHVNEQVLAVRLKEVDEKLNFFNTKLDAELKVVDASMRAAQTVFDQTKVRTDEIINCRGARTSGALPGNGADFCARIVRLTRDLYLRTTACCLRTGRPTCEPRRLRTLGENDTGVPARSPSEERC